MKYKKFVKCKSNIFRVNLHEDILKMDKAYDTKVGE